MVIRTKLNNVTVLTPQLEQKKNLKKAGQNAVEERNRHYDEIIARTRFPGGKTILENE